MVKCVCGQLYDPRNREVAEEHYEHPLQGGWTIPDGATFMVETMMERDELYANLHSSA